MPNLTWANQFDPFPTVRGASFATFTTAQDISPLPLRTTKASDLVLGSVVRLKAAGEHSTTATPTLQLGFGYGAAAGGVASGGATLALSAAITTASGAASFPWIMEYIGTVVATGTAGQIDGQGWLMLGTSLTAFAAPVPLPVTAAARLVTIDTTVAKAWNVIAAYSASSGSNAVRVDTFSPILENANKPG